MNAQELFLILMVFGGGAYVLVPIARAIAKRIAGEVPRRAEAELSDAVLAELQDLRADMVSLAERVDFTERLLARQREAERLAPPRGAGGA